MTTKRNQQSKIYLIGVFRIAEHQVNDTNELGDNFTLQRINDEYVINREAGADVERVASAGRMCDFNACVPKSTTKIPNKKSCRAFAI